MAARRLTVSGRQEDAEDDSTALEGTQGPHRVEVHPGKVAVVEFDPALTFECVPECTWCCHHGVLLYEDDFYELAERAPLAETTSTFRGEDFVQKETKARKEHVGEDGMACVFLGDDGLCALHADDGWKPTRCSVFPLEVREKEGTIHVDIRGDAREHCEGLDVSDRRLIDNLDAFLPPVLWELENPETAREL